MDSSSLKEQIIQVLLKYNDLHHFGINDIVANLNEEFREVVIKNLLELEEEGRIEVFVNEDQYRTNYSVIDKKKL